MNPLSRTAACLLLCLAPSAAHAQGGALYDRYRDANGDPHYSGNLTPAPDDRTLLGPTVAAGDPWLIRTRPARGWGDLDDVNAGLGGGFWEWQADRAFQRRQNVDALDRERRR